MFELESSEKSHLTLNFSQIITLAVTPYRHSGIFSNAHTGIHIMLINCIKFIHTYFKITQYFLRITANLVPNLFDILTSLFKSPVTLSFT